ncbi:MAG: biopolymer transporter ExbD [Myxococcota bacterium]
MAKLTPSQRAYIKKRSKYEEPGPDELDEELNIVPFLDIVVNLIMFLLMVTSTIAFYAQVEASLPTYSRGGVGRRSADEQQLNLNVTVTDTGVIVSGAAGKLAPGCETTASGRVMTVPQQNGRYNWEALRACIAKVKREFPDEIKVTVSADPLVEYRNLINAMDAVRAPDEPDPPCERDDDGLWSGDCYFPEVLLSAGVR